MVVVDFVGIIVTMCLIGLRYPHLVVCAALIHEAGRIIMTLFFNGHIESVVAAGAFGATVATGIKSGIPVLLVLFSGAIANFIIYASIGGMEYEKSSRIMNPFSRVKQPFSIINLRLSILSVLINLSHVLGIWR